MTPAASFNSMSVLLTSFRHAGHYAACGWNPASIARWQPGGHAWPELDFLSAKTANGRPLKLRNFSAPIAGYIGAYGQALLARWADVAAWLKSLEPEGRDALCCWCPHSTVSARQLQAHGTFFCHTVLVGELVKGFRPDVPVYLDPDRENSAWQHLGPWWPKELLA